MAGVLLSVAGLVFLVVQAASDSAAWHVVGFAIFGASLILLYGASTLYHLLPLPESRKQIFRRIDHIMIYVLIAGTYTPVCLTVLRGGWGWTIFDVIWGLAVVGVFLKVYWWTAPRVVSTLLYVGMGWTVIVATVPLVESVGWAGLSWILLGGVFYTGGAVIYAFKWPNWHPRHFSFHELFHLLVMAGSLAHFWFMFRFVLPVT